MKLDLSPQKNNIEINQLYHPTGQYKLNFYEQVYIKNDFKATKFIPICLKEWFYLVKKGGLLIIDYPTSENFNHQTLEKLMWWLWKGSFEIISHTKINKKYSRFICQKTTNSKFYKDDINKWTFGIITNGKRKDWVELIINSIKEQNIPNYEIIICGTYFTRKEKNIKFIPFNQRDDKGWITKKKNLIVKNAKFENICMLHDRIILGKNWFKGMKQWGNCFENLGCLQLFEGVRVNDWIASHYFISNKGEENFSFESYIDYKDWYPSTFFLGQLNIFKKRIIVENNLWWDENLYYGQREDHDFSLNLYQNGFIHRFNNLSSVETLTNKYVNPTYIKYDPRSLEPKMELNNLNSYLKFITFLILKLLNIFGIKLSFNTLENIRGRIYTLLLLMHPQKYAHNKEWRKVVS